MVKPCILDKPFIKKKRWEDIEWKCGFYRDEETIYIEKERVATERNSKTGMVKCWQLSSLRLQTEWLSDPWMLYSSWLHFIPQGPEKHHFTLYVCTCFTNLQFSVLKPIVLYINISSLMGVRSHWEMFEKLSRIALCLFCQLLRALYAYVCDCVCVSVCVRGGIPLI